MSHQRETYNDLTFMRPPMGVRDRIFWPGVAGLMALVAGLGFWSASQENQTWDEGIHMAAGYAYLLRGDYTWNPEHPPLAKLMGALPLLALQPGLPVGGPAWKAHDQVLLGQEFLYRNRLPADRLLMAARSANILLAPLFLLAVAWWARRRFGTAAALWAAAMCALDPNLLAHARYVTTDFPVAAFYFLACAFWIEYLESNHRKWLALSAALFAMALVTKFSALLLVPTFAALYAIAWLRTPKEFPLRRLTVAAAALTTAFFLLVNLAYFREIGHMWNGHVPRLTAVVDRGNAIGAVLYRCGKMLRLPAHPYLTGLGVLAAHNSGGHPGYLLGMRSQKGWWYYFPVVLAVKSTLACLAAIGLLAVAGVVGFARRAGRAVSLAWVGLLFPPLVYFVVSATSAIDIGMRHILPVIPFVYVAAAGLWRLVAPHRWARFAALALLLTQTVEFAAVSPHYLAFFNAAAGGPNHGPEYLVDSNLDWGQDLKNLVKWLRAHGTDVAWCSYFGGAPMEYYGLKYHDLPAANDQAGWNDIDGFVAVSATVLEGVYTPPEDTARLRALTPVARVGWSIYVYDFRKRRDGGGP